MVPGVKPEAALGTFKENPSDHEAQLGGSVIQGKAGSWGEEPACGKGSLQGQASPIPHFFLRFPPATGNTSVSLHTHLCFWLRIVP